MQRFASLRQPIANLLRKKSDKHLRDSSLLIVERTLRLVVATGIGLYAARALGPASFGILAFAQSILVLVTALATLGLPEIALRDMSRDSGRKDIIMVAAFFARLGGGILALISATVIAIVSEGGADGAVTIVVIVVASLMFQASEAMEWRLISSRNIGIVAAIRVAASILASTAKIWILLVRPELVLFAIAITGEFVVTAILQTLVARRAFGHLQWGEILPTAKTLVVQCFPMMIRSGVISLYLRLDQLALAWIAGKTALGVYAAAARLVEVWFILPSAVMLVFAPGLAKLHADNRERFERRMALLLRAGAAAAVVFAVLLALVAENLISALFGIEYAAAAPMLTILGFSTIAGTIGAVSNLWYVNEGALRVALIHAALALFIAAGLYGLLVPLYGGVGAAVAFGIGQFVFNLLLVHMTPSTKSLAKLHRMAFIPGFRT